MNPPVSLGSMTTDSPRLFLPGQLVVLGCGSVSRCLQPLLLRHVDMDFSRLTIIDFEDPTHTDRADIVAATTASGATYIQERLRQDNYSEVLSRLLVPGDVVVNLTWDVKTADLVQWCHEHGTRYIDTSVELWESTVSPLARPIDRTLYVRHMELRRLASRWSAPTPTAIVEHGANPGVVSHWVRVALEDITQAMLSASALPSGELDSKRRGRLEAALERRDYAHLAMETGTKTIHISERDTQVSSRPKEVGEFVNTWSIPGFFEEGCATAEMGWGTHERVLPDLAYSHNDGPGNQICLARPGMDTWVRSWVPLGGQIEGMVIRHGEAFTISDRLTARDSDGGVVYRPTVHYAYLPCDAALASLREMRMAGYRLQERHRILTDDIIHGRDELGVLLLGHDLTAWWTGSQLDIQETRQLVGPGHNATTLQVAASVLGALAWLLNHPDRGLCVPDDLDHEEVLNIANKYLGPCPSVQSSWTPLQCRKHPFEQLLGQQPAAADEWQFLSYLAP